MKLLKSPFRLLNHHLHHFQHHPDPKNKLLAALIPSSHHRHPQQLATRSFLTATSPPLHLHATRRLPYAATPLYALIADIAAYPAFLPFCTASAITSWSAPYSALSADSSLASSNRSTASTASKDAAGAESAPKTAATATITGTATTTTKAKRQPPSPSSRRWPRTATLNVGWAGLTESFQSRVFCAPDQLILEALAGAAQTTIPAAKLYHYDHSSENNVADTDGKSGAGGFGHRSGSIMMAEQGNNSVFKSLRTRWELRRVSVPARRRERGEVGEYGFGNGLEQEMKQEKQQEMTHQRKEVKSEETGKEEHTEVRLTIEVEWASVIYAALSQAAAPKVAGVLIEAFEKRAEQVLGRKH